MRNNKKGNFKKLSSLELARIFEQLSVLSKSGLATWESVQIISANASSPNEKNLIHHLSEQVVNGAIFSEAMLETEAFPDYACGMIEVGEQTGSLENVYNALTQYYLGKDKVSRAIRSVVVYPLAMATMVFAVIFVLLTQVMPVFEQVFSQLGLALNPISVFLLDIGNVLNDYGIVFLVVILVFVLIFVLLKVTRKGRAFLSMMFERSPITKKLSDYENANHFAFGMSLMLESGLDILNALEFAIIIVKGTGSQRRIERIISLVERGEGLTEAIIDSKIFDPSYNSIIVAGMRSGSSAEMLMSVADSYYDETERHIQKLLSIVEPSIVAILCILVGMVMISVMLPLTSILSSM